MSIQLNEENGGRIVTVHVSGKFEKSDYEHLLPEFERLVRQHGRLCLLFDMSYFHGWDAGAAWEDFKFGMKHFGDIDRHAMVGEDLFSRSVTRLFKASVSFQFCHQ